MTEEKLLEKINQLIEIDTQESNKEIIELIDKEANNFKNGKEKTHQYALLKNKCEIRLLELQLEALDENDAKKKIHITGKMIKLYKKQMSLETDNKNKTNARYKVLELLEKQKELTKNYKKSNNNLKISEKLALTIKDISNSIKIFIEKKDIITKAKNIFKEVSFGSIESIVFMSIVALISSCFGGASLSLSLLSNVLPVVSYIGLSSIIRNGITKTQFQEYQYYQSEEYKKYVEIFKEQNKVLLENFNNLLKEKQSTNNLEEKIEINDALIKKADELIGLINNNGLRKSYEIIAFECLTENKELCKQVIDEYLDEKNDDKERYKQYTKKLSKINIELFKRGNSIKESLIYAGKQTGLSLGAMVVAKAITSVIAPNSTYALKNLNSLVLPTMLSITNGILSIPTYSGKLKYHKTKEEKEIKPKKKDIFDKLFGQEKLKPVVQGR